MTEEVHIKVVELGEHPPPLWGGGGRLTDPGYSREDRIDVVWENIRN